MVSERDFDNVTVYGVVMFMDCKANVTLNDFLRRFVTIRCCHKHRCNVTCHSERFSAYPEKRQHVACF